MSSTSTADLQELWGSKAEENTAQPTERVEKSAYKTPPHFDLILGLETPADPIVVRVPEADPGLTSIELGSTDAVSAELVTKLRVTATERVGSDTPWLRLAKQGLTRHVAALTADTLSQDVPNHTNPEWEQKMKMASSIVATRVHEVIDSDDIVAKLKAASVVRQTLERALKDARVREVTESGMPVLEDVDGQAEFKRVSLTPPQIVKCLQQFDYSVEVALASGVMRVRAQDLAPSDVLAISLLEHAAEISRVKSPSTVVEEGLVGKARGLIEGYVDFFAQYNASETYGGVLELTSTAARIARYGMTLDKERSAEPWSYTDPVKLELRRLTEEKLTEDVYGLLPEKALELKKGMRPDWQKTTSFKYSIAYSERGTTATRNYEVRRLEENTIEDATQAVLDCMAVASNYLPEAEIDDIRRRSSELKKKVEAAVKSDEYQTIVASIEAMRRAHNEALVERKGDVPDTMQQGYITYEMAQRVGIAILADGIWCGESENYARSRVIPLRVRDSNGVGNPRSQFNIQREVLSEALAVWSGKKAEGHGMDRRTARLVAGVAFERAVEELRRADEQYLDYVNNPDLPSPEVALGWAPPVGRLIVRRDLLGRPLDQVDNADILETRSGNDPFASGLFNERLLRTTSQNQLTLRRR